MWHYICAAVRRNGWICIRVDTNYTIYHYGLRNRTDLFDYYYYSPQRGMYVYLYSKHVVCEHEIVKTIFKHSKVMKLKSCMGKRCSKFQYSIDSERPRNNIVNVRTTKVMVVTCKVLVCHNLHVSADSSQYANEKHSRTINYPVAQRHQA